jgi:hypothetical protein
MADSNNSLTAFNPEIWRSVMQETFFKESTALGVVSADLRNELAIGDTLHQPYGSYARVQTYTKGADISVKDIDSTDDYITVTTAKVASFYVDAIDKKQSKYPIIEEFASGAQRQLNNVLDQAVLGQYSNAGTTLDAAAVGGIAGNGIVLSQSNVAGLFTAQGRVLNNNKRLGTDRFTMIGPRILEVIQNYVGGRETGFGEKMSDNGLIARRFGFDLILSNNLPWSATLTLSVKPTDGDTVTINGVTFTFKDALTGATTLGEVLIGDSASEANTNLAKAVNDSGTVDTHYSKLSSENRQLIEESGLTATAGASSTAFTGYGDIVVSEVFSSDSNVWGSQLQYALSGIRGSVALITQITPNVEFRDAQLRLGKYVHPWMLYGVGTFERNKKSLVATKFDVSDWV